MNTQVYGQQTPPQIDISVIKDIPIAIFVGQEDPLANPKDCEWVRKQLQSVVHYEVLADFDHSSFAVGKDMSYFARVLSLIRDHQSV